MPSLNVHGAESPILKRNSLAPPTRHVCLMTENSASLSLLMQEKRQPRIQKTVRLVIMGCTVEKQLNFFGRPRHV